MRKTSSRAQYVVHDDGNVKDRTCQSRRRTHRRESHPGRGQSTSLVPAAPGRKRLGGTKRGRRGLDTRRRQWLHHRGRSKRGRRGLDTRRRQWLHHRGRSDRGRRGLDMRRRQWLHHRGRSDRGRRGLDTWQWHKADRRRLTWQLQCVQRRGRSNQGRRCLHRQLRPRGDQAHRQETELWPSPLRSRQARRSLSTSYEAYTHSIHSSSCGASRKCLNLRMLLLLLLLGTHELLANFMKNTT